MIKPSRATTSTVQSSHTHCTALLYAMRGIWKSGVEECHIGSVHSGPHRRHRRVYRTVDKIAQFCRCHLDPRIDQDRDARPRQLGNLALPARRLKRRETYLRLRPSRLHKELQVPDCGTVPSCGTVAGRRTVLVAEQQVPLAMAFTDRGYVLENGRIRTEGTSAELAQDPEVRRAYLGVT